MRRFPWPDARFSSHISHFSVLPLHHTGPDRYTAHVLAKTHARSLAAAFVAAMAMALGSLALASAPSTRTERTTFSAGLASASVSLLTWATHDDGDFADSTKSAHYFPAFLAERPRRVSDVRAIARVIESAATQFFVLASVMQRGPPAWL